ncbi:MAG TPA: hypothetical protein VNQ80_09385 [Parapedobacter sp.]|uniref:hypothetical protein n=1 Tax=Parapedobacter sp. TaxID=1958893 RepID=UPI002CDAD6DE|nr:hypothetical protein [Parapedobacter sp.]HWK57539.1 hypothetical protein [Parapedobacter sp.]
MLESNSIDRIIIIAPVSAISKRLRLSKLVKFIFCKDEVHKGQEFKVIHKGWERLKGEGRELAFFDKIEKDLILKGGGYGGKVKYMYFLWMVKVFFSCLKLKKDEVIWALGFESAFPVLIAGLFRKFKVVFDDADRFSLVFNFPKPISWLIKNLEVWTSRKAFQHIIPGIERYDFTSNKFYIIKNTPSFDEIEAAKKIYQKKLWPKADLIININGLLSKDRGLNIALQLSRDLKDYDIKFILAGRLACKEADELSKQGNVYYLGNVSNAEALASYFASDLVLTYFDPRIKINQLAESNKWGDAIKTGNGIIVNSEVQTAQYLRNANAAISFDYSDGQGLAERLKILSRNAEEKNQIKKNAGLLANKYGYFEEQLTLFFRQNQLDLKGDF